jgi:hypothetical protein
MFLNQLNEEQKENFLELAYYAANINNDFAEEQKQMLDSYKLETSMTSYVIQEKKIDEIVAPFTDTKSKKIALLEAIAILYSDKKITPEESDLMDQFTTLFSSSQEDIDFIKKWVELYFEAVEGIASFINN